MEENQKHSNITFLIAYALMLYLIGLMIWPFLSSFIFAFILAGTFYPLHLLLIQRYTIRPNYSATLVLLLIVISVFAPATYLAVQLSSEAIDLYQYLKENLTNEMLESLIYGQGYSSELLRQVFGMLNLDLNIDTLQTLVLDAAKNTSAYLFNTLNAWVGNLFSFLFQFVIMLLVIFALLAHGEKIKRFLLDLSPLPDDEEELVIEKFNQMNHVTMIGNGIGGVIQGTFAGMGFWVAGIHSVALWTTAMVILAFIPMVGISVIYIPASIYLAFTGHVSAAVLLFLYCTLVAVVVEQWFKPKFVGGRVQINSVLVLLSIVGGMSQFGFAGIFYGPLIITIFLTFANLYHKRYNKRSADLFDTNARSNGKDQDFS